MVCQSMSRVMPSCSFSSLLVSLLVRSWAAVALVLLAGCASVGSGTGNWQRPLIFTKPAVADIPPPAPREFRAAWVATVANIDWPSKLGLSTAQQQAEIINIVNRAKELNLNALVLQVRTSADAFYPSALEPWSEYLTGEQGKAPVPFYDPLKMWIDEAHRRGIELHAWFNPYRARHNQAKSPLSRTHFASTNPAAVKSYGGYLWMDPGEEAASKQTLNVILDVVRRYDIDGVHIDDYFYPYPVPVPGSATPPPSADDTPAPAVELPFPDEASWQAYLAKGGQLTRADWRRQNVNVLIEKIYKSIHREKNWVRFGISPFGLGKPSQRPPGITGFSQYDKLYADAELWLQKGWLDYFTPQLYWAINQPAQAYGTLLDYWMSQNTLGRHVWPGLYTSRINNTDKSWLPAEILNQIALTRSRAEQNALVRGQVHFSMIALMENRKGIGDQLKSDQPGGDQLRAGPYASAALVPIMPWLNSGAAPELPSVIIELHKVGRPHLKLKLAPGAGVTSYALWIRYGTVWRFSVLPAAVLSTTVPTTTMTAAEMDFYIDSPAGPLNMMAVSAVDRLGNESSRVFVRAAEPENR